MRAGLKTGVAALAVSVGMAAPGVASAKVKTYGGKIFPSGRIALDVKVGKKSKPKKVVAIRAVDVPVECEISDTSTVWTEFPNLDIPVRKGGFKYSFRDPKYGNKKAIKGEFKKKNKVVGGGFTYSHHFLAEPGLPEEDCDAGTLLYSAKRGGKDVVVPPPEANAAARRG